MDVGHLHLLLLLALLFEISGVFSGSHFFHSKQSMTWRFKFIVEEMVPWNSVPWTSAILASSRSISDITMEYRKFCSVHMERCSSAPFCHNLVIKRITKNYLPEMFTWVVAVAALVVVEYRVP